MTTYTAFGDLYRRLGNVKTSIENLYGDNRSDFDVYVGEVGTLNSAVELSAKTSRIGFIAGVSTSTKMTTKTVQFFSESLRNGQILRLVHTGTVGIHDAYNLIIEIVRYEDNDENTTFAPVIKAETSLSTIIYPGEAYSFIYRTLTKTFHVIPGIVNEYHLPPWDSPIVTQIQHNNSLHININYNQSSVQKVHYQLSGSEDQQFKTHSSASSYKIILSEFVPGPWSFWFTKDVISKKSIPFIINYAAPTMTISEYYDDVEVKHPFPVSKTVYQKVNDTTTERTHQAALTHLIPYSLLEGNYYNIWYENKSVISEKLTNQYFKSLIDGPYFFETFGHSNFNFEIGAEKLFYRDESNKTVVQWVPITSGTTTVQIANTVLNPQKSWATWTLRTGDYSRKSIIYIAPTVSKIQGNIVVNFNSVVFDKLLYRREPHVGDADPPATENSNSNSAITWTGAYALFDTNVQNNFEFWFIKNNTASRRAIFKIPYYFAAPIVTFTTDFNSSSNLYFQLDFETDVEDFFLLDITTTSPTPIATQVTQSAQNYARIHFQPGSTGSTSGQFWYPYSTFSNKQFIFWFKKSVGGNMYESERSVPYHFPT